jgi:hypothetical protein
MRVAGLLSSATGARDQLSCASTQTGLAADRCGRGLLDPGSFLCRTPREIRDKAAELDLRIYEPADVEQRTVKPPTLNGHELSEESLEQLRQHIEELDYIDEISDEAHELIAHRWPHLLAKLKPPAKQ